jgi:hypothetical protein
MAQVSANPGAGKGNASSPKERLNASTPNKERTFFKGVAVFDRKGPLSSPKKSSDSS